MTNEVWIFENKPIPVSFNTDGYVYYQGGRGLLGSPTEAHSRLVAVKGEDRILIPSVADLKGRVVIKGPAKALSFVRLFTAIETHYLFPDSHLVEPREAHGSPGPGEYTPAYGQRMGLMPARARREGHSFIVERNLVDRQGKLVRGTERVGHDGAYALLKTDVIDEHSPITYPLYQ